MTTAPVLPVTLLAFHPFTLPLSVAWATVLAATQLCASKGHTLRKGKKTQRNIICSRHPHQSRLLASELLLSILFIFRCLVNSFPCPCLAEGHRHSAMESCGVNRKKNPQHSSRALPSRKVAKITQFSELSWPPWAVLGMADWGQMAPGRAPAIQLCGGSCLVKEEVALLGKLSTWSSASASTELTQICWASSLQSHWGKVGNAPVRPSRFVLCGYVQAPGCWS